MEWECKDYQATLRREQNEEKTNKVGARIRARDDSGLGQEMAEGWRRGATPDIWSGSKSTHLITLSPNTLL